jgi:hypothetical protein
VAINDVLIVIEMDWLPEIEWKVLLALAHIKNHKTGLCYPSYEEISRIAHTSRNSVALSIPKLKNRGLLSWTPGNQHYSNRYTLHLQQYRERATGNTADSQQCLEDTPENASPTVQQYSSGTRGVLEPVNLQAPRTAHRNKSVEEIESDTVPYSTVRFAAEPTESPDGEDSPSANPYQLSAEDSRSLGQIFNLVIPDNADKDGEAHTEFSLFRSATPPAKIANCLVWAFTKSNWWKQNLAPTVGDFLRALPRIEAQYDKFFASGKKKPHDVWDTTRAVLEKASPVPLPPPEEVCEDGEVHIWIDVLHTTQQCSACGTIRTHPAVTQWTEVDDLEAEYMEMVELVECYDPYDACWSAPEEPTPTAANRAALSASEFARATGAGARWN